MVKVYELGGGSPCKKVKVNHPLVDYGETMYGLTKLGGLPK